MPAGEEPIPPALAAAGDRVYVLRGSTLTCYSAAGLKLIGKVVLPEERPLAAHGPWESDLLAQTSADGSVFDEARVFVAAAGVPSLIKDAKGRLVAAFQWFPADDPVHFDRVAVAVSEDGGKTWSEPWPIEVDGLPEGYQRPFDPTLAALPDGRIRIYYSCGPQTGPGPQSSIATYSAISTDGVHYTFEPEARFAVAGRRVIDCAVARLGNKWHYTAPIGRPEEGAYHAVSDDGIHFTRLPDIPSVDRVNWTGNLVAWNGGLRFYGCSDRGIWWSFSTDGAAWSRPTYTGVFGGDPAVVPAGGGKYLMVCVGAPRDPQPQALQSPAGAIRPTAGPYTHQICSATSPDGLTWTRDDGARLVHASVPCAVADGDRRILLYYVDADRGPGRSESVGCAVSEDGVRFEKQPFAIEGMTSAKALDPCVLKDDTGAFRLYYYAAAHGDPGRAGTHAIHLALSQDGVHFRDSGPVFEHPRLVDPDVFAFQGKWLMFVFGEGQTVVASSPDGRRFAYHGPLGLPGWGTTAPLLLEDGRLRLYAFQQFTRGNVVRSFLSADGLHWTPEPGDRLAAGPGEEITDPFVIRWRRGYRMYFKTQAPQ